MSPEVIHGLSSSPSLEEVTDRALSTPLNRRKFILSASLASASLLFKAHPINAAENPTDSGKTASDAESALLEMKQSVETKRGIIMNTLQDAINDTGYDYGVSNPTPIEWTAPQTQLLDDILGVLPEHMYTKEGDNYLHFTLMATKDDPCPCAALEIDIPNSDYAQVILVDQYFSPESASDSLVYVTHESVHRATEEYKHQDNPNVDAVLGESYSSAREKPGGLIDTLRKVKKPLFDKVQALQTKLGSQDKAVAALSDEEKEKYRFYNEQMVALGMDWYQLDTSMYPDEFVAVMGEYYIRGKETFMRNYPDLFTEDGEAKAEGLYNYMKSIFKQEYTSLPTIKVTV